MFRRVEKEGVSDLFRAIVPLGHVKAVRQEYEVFRTASGDYLVFSPSSRGSSSYHMTLLSSGKVEAIAAAMGSGGVSAGTLMKDPELQAVFGRGDSLAMRFAILTGLYILAAAGRAEMKKDGRNLVFTRLAE